MENGLRSIVTENDLEYYEKNLKLANFGEGKQIEPLNSICKKNLLKHMDFHRGKLMRVEIIFGGCVKFKVGKLIEIGEDYISLKHQKDLSTAVIPIKNIQAVTIYHYK